MPKTPNSHQPRKALVWPNRSKTATFSIAAGVAIAGASACWPAFAAANACAATSGPTVTPVIELFTSEGCSSCPPADKWASGFKDNGAAGGAVVQAFHVGYWDYIGWVDRFAAPAYTQRQRDIVMRQGLRSAYTPQAVINGKDWPNWSGVSPASVARAASQVPARTQIALQQVGKDQFEATITPLQNAGAGASPTSWSAYWTVTEHSHNSKVQAGENAGEFLKHDFVVRQYTQAGEYKAGSATEGGAQKLTFRSIAPTPGHARQVNLVVFEPKTGATLQALSLQCVL